MIPKYSGRGAIRQSRSCGDRHTQKNGTFPTLLSWICIVTIRRDGQIYRGTLNKYQTVRVPYEKEDGAVAMKMAEYHKSQLSPQMLEMWKQHMQEQEKVGYLRSFVQSEKESYDLFEYAEKN